MFYATTVSSVVEEVARKSWPAMNNDASILEEYSWEILNDNDSHSFLNRHWFKQNYGIDRRQQNNDIKYH